MSKDPVPIEIAISTALKNKRDASQTVIGVVVDLLSPFPSARSAVVTFTIKDSHYDCPSFEGGLKIKYFHDDMDGLPPVKLNDVVLIRDITIDMWRENTRAISTNRQTRQWAIFRSNIDPTADLTVISGPRNFEPKPMEKRIASSLVEYVATHGSLFGTESIHVEASMSARTSARKKGHPLPLTLIKDVEMGCLYQLVGQIVKVIHGYERSTLYITDFTENKELQDIPKDGAENGTDGDSFSYIPRRFQDWPGPWGKMILQVTLWEPHASFTVNNDIKQGDIVHITYAAIKNSIEGLECSVHEDKWFKSKVHIKVVSSEFNEAARDLMKRRKEYWKDHVNTKEDSIEKKKSRKTKKSEQDKHEDKEDKQPLPTPRPGKVSRTKLNPHIKTREYGARVLSIESILSAEAHDITLRDGITYKLPFQNVCYRTNVRVIDFFPPKLEDFAVEIADKPIAKHGSDSEPESQPMLWEWCFCLLVEGTDPASKESPREQMRIFVSGAEAQHLLSLDAANLRHDKQRLEELREQLFLLWGDLEECKRSGSAHAGKNLPFPCCIKEYGVQCNHAKNPDAMDVDGEPCGKEGCFGWDRRFAIFGTQIRAH